MWWEDKIMRTFRCRLQQVPGTLGRFLSLLGEAGGDVGEIRVVRQGAGHVERDIVVFADSPAHMERLIALAGRGIAVDLLEVRDDVLEHQGGKIAIRSRYKIDSLDVLRKVYTPGVAEVCLRIKDDPAGPPLHRHRGHRHRRHGRAGLGDIGRWRPCRSWRARPA